MARGDLTDAEWRIVEPLLPNERRRKSRPSHNNRQFMNGLLHFLRVGCPWRDMHERYESGVPSTSDSGAGPSKEYGMRSWKRLWNSALQ